MKIRILIACAFVLASPGAALAASGDEIRAAIAGNTIQGSIGARGTSAEFYDPSGAIKGKDYVGQWSVQGNLLCVSYQYTPKECWNVDINGHQMRWLKNGAAQGSGTIIRGNPGRLGKVP